MTFHLWFLILKCNCYLCKNALDTFRVCWSWKTYLNTFNVCWTWQKQAKSFYPVLNESLLNFDLSSMTWCEHLVSYYVNREQIEYFILVALDRTIYQLFFFCFWMNLHSNNDNSPFTSDDLLYLNESILNCDLSHFTSDAEFD